jgi:threonine dehydrogenase-like Zn-dependent dehydrogenase
VKAVVYKGPYRVSVEDVPPSLLVSHEVALTDAPAAYEKFDKRVDGYTKVLLHPAGV